MVSVHFLYMWASAPTSFCVFNKSVTSVLSVSQCCMRITLDPYLCTFKQSLSPSVTVLA